jgi:hypothetical protein
MNRLKIQNVFRLLRTSTENRLSMGGRGRFTTDYRMYCINSVLHGRPA